MAQRTQSPDLIIVGAGIIGLSVAWQAHRRGLAVTVLEREQAGRGTSHVAAGMLAPVAEAEFGEAGQRLLELGLRSADMWPAFAAELEAAAGVEVGLLRTGTLLLARDADEARELERQAAFRDSLGLATTRLRPSEAREREPALAPTMRMALEAADDHSVDPRMVLSALRRACRDAGVDLRERTAVARLALDAAGRRVAGVALQGADRPQRTLAAPRVLIAAGAWSGQLDGLPDAARVPVRPVKGQILRLRDPAGPGLLGRVVRFGGGYLVPRADGRYVLGATVEERGFELRPAVGGIYELLRDAHEAVPGVSELEIEELCVGLRPGTPDNVPVIGPGALEGLFWATGHHRNGILLAPLTAARVVALLAGEGPVDPLLPACSPLRFIGAGSRPGANEPLAAQAGRS
jgi:glycine oxidase